MQIIQKNHSVKTRETVYTKYVFCIDEVCNEGDHSWVYYVNGKPLSLSTDIYKPRDGDVVELRYGKV
ncbi:MAG: DUF4430 domain-containing protein [Nanoarchaeota archaeon]|nr:DUF4430 domain-containing protein [Nanoarchaeota archaeon]MBU1603954.1 DUF4430 domain-containing protein [Nanoarchaeota archaeon]